ncbi:MAG: LysR family transcriptional regulator [Inhella sp.]
MELNDLRLFACAARHASLQQAAAELHLTPSALSKAIKRLEQSLRTPLFERQGKGLLLNEAGARLQQRALALLHLAEQTRAEFAGAAHAVDCRLAGPALLLARYAPAAAAALQGLGSAARLRLLDLFELEALQALQRGEADFALVSAAVLTGYAAPAGLARLALETLPMRLGLAPQHPLAAARNVGATELEQADFVCPTRSLFCGLRRGPGSDGWRDEALPRRIRYRVDDLHSLLTMVRSGHALAYLPEFLIRQEGLLAKPLRGAPFHCEEQALLLWRPAAAMGWQARWVEALRSLV